jgi:glycerol uptake facilitator-like aquaporin
MKNKIKNHYIKYSMYNYLVEFLGSIFFVYIILATGNPLAIGAAFALILLLTRNISSGFFNPAVSIVMVSIGKIEVNDLIPYILAQTFGALVALEIYKRYKI